MSTLAGLMQALATSTPAPYGDIQAQTASTRGREVGNETALIKLAELKRSQASEEQMMTAIKNDPELAKLILGDGSALASLQNTPAPMGGPPAAGPLTQQTVQPGQPPQAPQMVPGGQDLSQFATQGGPPQSTIASLGPQPQPQMQAPRNPVLEMARKDPRVAMMLYDRQTKMQEQRLDMGTKIAGSVARIVQGVTDQASLDKAREEIGLFDQRAAAQLPQFYSKEALEPFIKRAFTAQETADVRLKTWHQQTEERKNQLEEMKIGIQLTNAGYQGLGTDVTSILRGLTDEQVKQFGGRTSPQAIAYATEEEKKRKLGQAGEAERLKFELEEKQRSTLPLQDARKEDSGLFVSKGTGQTIPGTTPYGQVKQLQDEKDPEKGVIKLANLDEKKQLTTLKQLEPVLQQYADLVQYAYGTDEKTGKKGPLADYQRGPFQTIGAMWNQLSQDDPVFQAKRRALEGQLQSVVRGLGARGDLNEQELVAAQQMLANMDASLGLGLSLGPMVGTGGIGVGGSIKPTIKLPDTPETGINVANELIGTVNRRIGSILQHEGYSKTPFIRIRTDQEKEAKPGEMPRATAPPKPPPPPPPAAGPPIFPRPEIREPGAPAPGKQSQATPGRRGIELARASGAKVMDMVDVEQAMEETGKSRAEVLAAARAKGYTVYGAAASSALA